MKGVVFNVVQEVVEDQLGADAWDDAIDRSGVDGSYTSLGNYPDTDLHRLADAVGELAHMSQHDVLVFSGRHGFRHLAARHPDLVGAFAGWRDVVNHLDDIIHPEVEKIYAAADTPTFTVEDTVDSSLTMVYQSKRQLCALAEGLVLGLGDWFEVGLVVSHVECVHEGGDRCVLEVAET